MQINTHSTLSSLHALNDARNAKGRRLMQAAQASANPKPKHSVSDVAPGKPALPKPAQSIQSPAATDPSAVTMIECGPAAPQNGGPQSPDDTLTLQGLYGAWGQTKSPYDLTGDGMVDVDDLLAFINGLSAPPSQDPPDNAVTLVEPLNTVSLADPPTATVSVENEPSLAEPANELSVADPASDPQPQLTMNGFYKTWGQSNDEYDLNNDGTVDVDDLMAYINSLSSQNNPQEAQQPSQPGPIEMADKAAQLKLAQTSINNLADTLIDKLIGAGFEDQPPTNVRELVDKLQLSPRDTNHMFRRLGAQYPRGLGVNMMG